MIRIRGIRFLYTRLIHPRTTRTETQRKEFILNVILIGTLVLCGFLFISIIISHILPNDSYSGISPILFLCISGFFAFLLKLSRSGHVTLSSYFLIGTYAIATIYGVFQWSFVLPMIILSALVTIVISSILIHSRFGFLLTFILSLIICGITLLQLRGVIPMDVYWKHDPIVFQDVLEICCILFGVSGIAWLSNRETERSLARALSSEQALIEERNLLEIRIEERTKDLKELQHQEIIRLEHFAELGKISSGVFHDLMNPLSGVIAHIDQINEKVPHLHETKEYLHKAVVASKRMGEYLSIIRNHIKLREDACETFQPSQEIRDALALLGHTLRINMVRVDVQIDQEVSLLGNPLRFHQTVLNLITNACDSYRGSDETIPRLITICLYKEPHSLILKITDYGCGIDTQLQEKIFEPFFTTKKEYGSGIGLYHTRLIIENEFHGTITCASNLNQGTTFTLTFPLRENLHTT
jgi:signal transduction histidine kinase